MTSIVKMSLEPAFLKDYPCAVVTSLFDDFKSSFLTNSFTKPPPPRYRLFASLVCCGVIACGNKKMNVKAGVATLIILLHDGWFDNRETLDAADLEGLLLLGITFANIWTEARDLVHSDARMATKLLKKAMASGSTKAKTLLQTAYSADTLFGVQYDVSESFNVMFWEMCVDAFKGTAASLSALACLYTNGFQNKMEPNHYYAFVFYTAASALGEPFAKISLGLSYCGFVSNFPVDVDVGKSKRELVSAARDGLFEAELALSLIGPNVDLADTEYDVDECKQGKLTYARYLIVSLLVDHVETDDDKARWEGMRQTMNLEPSGKKKKKKKKKKAVDTQDDEVTTLGGGSTCIVCFLEEKTHACVPCGHQCVCAACSGQLTECPVCRATATQWMKVHLV